METDFKGRIILRLTRGQQMALIDIITEHLRCPNHTETFVNCSEANAPETSIGEILRLVSG